MKTRNQGLDLPPDLTPDRRVGPTPGPPPSDQNSLEKPGLVRGVRGFSLSSVDREKEGKRVKIYV
jgi:hypothetical protein